MPQNALLLIAHGSRLAEANADLDHVAAEIRRRGTFFHFQSAFLELAEPNIAAGAVRCVQAGAEEIILLPYFLSPGVHVTEDLTAARAELADRFRNVAFRLAPPIGRHPLLADIVIQRAGETPA
jgi:sirohydrochlorin ferrochelatase